MTAVDNCSKLSLQRRGKGGRPALVVNRVKYHVENLTNISVQVPWGVEAVWCTLTPKSLQQDSIIKKIVCCSFYSKPHSKTKTLLLDHISDTYTFLTRKYGLGTHFILAGDSNDLKLEPVLNLNHRFVQIVQHNTRMNPPALLDPVLMTLSQFYQVPVCLDPLAPDSTSLGSQSDHKMVLVRPLTTLNNKSARITIEVRTRPITKPGLDKMFGWLKEEKWEAVFSSVTAHEKASIFQNMLLQKYHDFFPEKVLKINSDDQPWISHKIKQIDRNRKRLYRKQGKSIRWQYYNKLYKAEIKLAKQNFYKKMISDLKQKKPGQWYSALKRISNFNENKSNQYNIEEIAHLPSSEQAERIAEQFVSIQNQYDPLNKADITIPIFKASEIPQFMACQVWLQLVKIRTNVSTVPGDIPAKLIKLFASYLAEPLTDIINSSISRGEYPNIYKFEHSTPVPKIFPPKKLSQLRNISGLLNFDKVMEKLLSQLIIGDMQANFDPSQFGNQKGVGIQHYLVKMIHRILTVTDSRKQKESLAVIASFIDWENAFPRQCPKLGVESFISNGVRPSLIPILVNFFQDRMMSLKWKDSQTKPKRINGGGPQGATLGIIGYLSQSNNCADSVNVDDRFRFIDDLSILEIINLLTIGLSSYNVKHQVPSDVSCPGLYIDPENLKTQRHMNEINDWTKSKTRPEV